MTSGSIYEHMGVRTIINGRGPTTAVGGSLLEPEVLAAMADASNLSSISKSSTAPSAKIAEVTGAEAGYVTSGSAAGMVLAVAACVAGSDPVKDRRAPR